VEQQSVSVRRHRSGDLGSLKFSEFIGKVSAEVNNRENPPKQK